MSKTSAIILGGNSNPKGGLPKQGTHSFDTNFVEGIYNMVLETGSIIGTLPKAMGRQRIVRVNLVSRKEEDYKIKVTTVGDDKILNGVDEHNHIIENNGQIVEYIELGQDSWRAIAISRGDKLDSRVGEFFFASVNKSNKDGLLEVKPGTIANGKNLYPVWASMYPMFISGNDIVFPNYVKDIFLRNTRDGNMGFENYKTALPTTNSFSTTSNVTNIFSGTNNTGSNNYLLPVYGGRKWQISAVDFYPKLEGKVDETLDDMYINASATHAHIINSGGDNETSPKNIKLRLYTVVDTYNR